MATMTKEKFRNGLIYNEYVCSWKHECGDCVFKFNGIYYCKPMTHEQINYLLSIQSDTITTEDVRAAIEKLNHQEGGE